MQPISYLVGFLIYFMPFAQAITDEDIVVALETLEDLEAAYPLAYKIAQHKNTYQAWHQVATKYINYDLDNQAYLQTWQLAYSLNQPTIYRNFLEIKPNSDFNRYGIYGLFNLLKNSYQIKNYYQFVIDFPNAIESIEALLKIHEFAFQKTKTINNVDMFDNFVTTFYGAKQIPQVIKLAFENEHQLIKQQINENSELTEQIARHLFTQGRIAEKQNQLLVAARKYELLKLDLFADTQVAKQLLSEKERDAFQNLLQLKQNESYQNIEKIQIIVTQIIQIENPNLELTILNTLANQNLTQIINTRNQLIIEQINIAKTILKPKEFNQINSNSAIANIINKILPIFKQAIISPSPYQNLLLE